MTDVRMSLSRFGELVSAYGADAARWPDNERDDALALLDKEPLAAAILEHERDLDFKLALAEPMHASSELIGRILAGAEKARIGWQDVLWPFGPLWQPVIAVACASAFGIVFGLLASPVDITLDLGLAIENVMLEL
jgi:hypothetical protein